MHVVDEGIDTGPILAQKRVEVAETDTGATLYRKLEDACVALLAEAWPRFDAGELTPVPQDLTAGTTHRVRDVEAIDRIDPGRAYTARELIDVIRARTFPPHKGAYIEVDGRRIHLRLDADDDGGQT